MRKDDAVRLQHMLDAAREACAFAREKVREDLYSDRQLTLALVKDIEIIGEAASRVSAETRTAHPGLPWQRVSQCGIASFTDTSTSTRTSSGVQLAMSCRH